MNEAEPGDGETQRRKLDADDHDLLTFGEAGERLRLEIQAAEAQVAQLGAGTPDAAALREWRARLSALRDAAQRNSAQPINDDNFETFFGYPGKAKRNLPVAPTEP